MQCQLWKSNCISHSYSHAPFWRMNWYVCNLISSRYKIEKVPSRPNFSNLSGNLSNSITRFNQYLMIKFQNIGRTKKYVCCVCCVVSIIDIKFQFFKSFLYYGLSISSVINIFFIVQVHNLCVSVNSLGYSKSNSIFRFIMHFTNSEIKISIQAQNLITGSYQKLSYL